MSVVDETPDATHWGDLLRAMADGDIDIAVVATLADLPPKRMARVETTSRRQPPRRPGLRAVVYGPAWDVTRWGRRGVSWCQQGELTICGLVVEAPDAHEWPAVVREMATGAVDVAVMGSWGPPAAASPATGRGRGYLTSGATATPRGEMVPPSAVNVCPYRMRGGRRMRTIGQTPA